MLDLLALLVNKSLVVQHQINDESRFSMLETIREYALAQLNEREDADTILWQHAQYYLKLAGTAEPELTGTRQVAWLERLEREHGNLRAALNWTLDHGQTALAAQLCGTLWHFWAIRGHLSEGRRWLQRARARGDRLMPSVRAMLLNGEGSLAYYQGDYEQALAFSMQSLALSREIGDKWLSGITLINLGQVAQDQGRYEQAQATHQESLSLGRELGC